MSAVASSSSGRVPQGEVIMEFADGGSYIKHKLEHSVLELEKRRITKDEGAKAEKAMKALDIKPVESVNSEDVDFVVSQLGCSKELAENALREEKGDLVKTLIKLVQPRPRARSVDGGAELKK
ncbi:hypothetical protein JCM24511_09648 [Saitozyma sp. JCM 24511]|nr:hypothetical protein JCM24511_09648 [Saitozyma sp. JCM 24511]